MLEWLPPAPPDFRDRCQRVRESPCADLRDVAALAPFDLDESQLARVARIASDVRARDGALAGFVPFTLGIVGNGTLDAIVPALEATALRYGVDLRCVSAPFGQTIQAALDPNSAINAAHPQAVLLALDHRCLEPATLGDAESARDAVARALERVDSMRRGFAANGGGFALLQTIAPPAEPLFGSLDRLVAGTPRALAASYNAGICERVEGSADVAIDIAALAQTVGLERWHNAKQWHLAKFPFDASFVPLYAEHVCRTIAAVRGRSRKCLVLDLDNTLWGGVIGDDGLEGIVLGQGDAAGEAFLDVQRLALALRERGVILSVSSKNDDAVARAAVRDHPEMLVREAHIACFQANWQDKASNLRAIARELNIGLDALVLLDDNPAERALVRAELPEVAVPEIGSDPSRYAPILAAAGYFESVAFSSDDRARAGHYEDNAKRAALAASVTDLDSFLRSLDMEIDFRPFDAAGRSRIVQLINKSNQFNLTTRRYTEADVIAFEADPSAFTLQIRLADAFGDNGMISVVIARPAGEDWEIDTWLMSCRVLGRRVEAMVLRELVLGARERGIRRLIGRYLPTPKNRLVEDHYARLGFELVERDGSGATVWSFATGKDVEAAPMRVVRAGRPVASGA